MPCEANAFSKADNFAICNNWKFFESVIDIFCENSYFYKKWSHTMQPNKNDFYDNSFHAVDVWKISLYFSKMHTMMMTSSFEICCWVKFYSHNSILFGNLTHSPLVWCTFWNAIVVAFLTLRYHNSETLFVKKVLQNKAAAEFFFFSFP